jgi:hypothetical protein
VNQTIKDIPEKTEETANSSLEIKETDAKGDETKNAEDNAMDNTEPDMKDTKAYETDRS